MVALQSGWLRVPELEQLRQSFLLAVWSQYHVSVARTLCDVMEGISKCQLHDLDVLRCVQLF